MSEIVIGMDIDGVLTDVHSFYIREGKRIFKKEPVNLEAQYFEEIFDLTEHEFKTALFKHGLTVLNKYCTKELPRPNAVEILNSLRENNCEIYAITARQFVTKKFFLGKYYRHLFEKWLDKNSIQFDGIEYCSGKSKLDDKYEACSKYKVDIMIEDEIENAFYLANKNIKVLLMDTPYNRKIEENSNIKRVYTWKEIETEIQKIHCKTNCEMV